MPRYIDADALMEDIEQAVRFSCRDGVPSAEMRGANKVIDRIEVAPTISPVDVRGVVRCKDCTFGESATDGDGNPCVLCGNSMVFDYPYAHDPDWFCADGEMKGAEDGTTDNS